MLTPEEQSDQGLYCLQRLLCLNTLNVYSIHFQVYLSLLKIYIEPPDSKVLGIPKYQYEPKPNHNAAITLLEEHHSSIDLIKVSKYY